MCGFCKVWVCVCVDSVKCGSVYVWILYSVCVLVICVLVFSCFVLFVLCFCIVSFMYIICFVCTSVRSTATE